MYAVIKTGGKQYKVEEGTEIRIERGKRGEEVVFDDVLLVADANNLHVGKAVKVTGTVVIRGEVKETAEFWSPQEILYSSREDVKDTVESKDIVSILPLLRSMA